MDEATWMALLSALLGPMPSVNSRGQVEAYDLGQQKDIFNMLQDQTQLLSDPIAAALGPSGSFDPRAFEPIVDSEVEMPTDWYTPYASLSPQSVERTVADAIQQGGAPSEVVEYLRSQGALSDDQLKDVVTPLAQDLWSQKAEYDRQIAALPKDENGNPVTQVTKPSEAAQVFLDAGLPLPTEQFVAQDFDPQLDSKLEERQRALQQYREQVGNQKNAEATARWGNAQPQGRNDVLPGMDLPRGGTGDEGSWEERGFTPQRGGIADDLERFTQSPGAVIGSLFGDADDPADFLDQNIGDPIERFFGGGPAAEGSVASGNGGRGASGMSAEELAQLVTRTQAANEARRAGRTANADAARRERERTVAARKKNERISTKTQGDAAYARQMQRNAAKSGDTPLRRAMIQRLFGAVGQGGPR